MKTHFEALKGYKIIVMSTEELLKRYAAGEREFTGIDLSEVDLSGVNLAGADLSGANLLGTDLSVANLSGVNLSNAKLDLANLTGANLEGANVTSASILAANLTNVNLKGTIGSFGLAHGALYHNSVMSDGEIFIGPDTIEA